MDEEELREQRAERLRERIYVTFTALAVVLVLRSEAEHTTAGIAAGTLAVTVVATLLAVFVADVVAHITVPSRAELADAPLAELVLGLAVVGLELLAH